MKRQFCIIQIFNEVQLMQCRPAPHQPNFIEDLDNIALSLQLNCFYFLPLQDLKIKCFQEKWAEIRSQSSNLFKNRNEKIQFSKSTKTSSKDIRSVLKNLQNRVQTDLKFLQGSKSEEFSKIEESLENLQDLMQNSNLECKI